MSSAFSDQKYLKESPPGSKLKVVVFLLCVVPGSLLCQLKTTSAEFVLGIADCIHGVLRNNTTLIVERHINPPGVGPTNHMPPLDLTYIPKLNMTNPLLPTSTFGWLFSTFRYHIATMGAQNIQVSTQMQTVL